MVVSVEPKFKGRVVLDTGALFSKQDQHKEINVTTGKIHWIPGQEHPVQYPHNKGWPVQWTTGKHPDGMAAIRSVDTPKMDRVKWAANPREALQASDNSTLRNKAREVGVSHDFSQKWYDCATSHSLCVSKESLTRTAFIELVLAKIYGTVTLDDGTKFANRAFAEFENPYKS